MIRESSTMDRPIDKRGLSTLKLRASLIGLVVVLIAVAFLFPSVRTWVVSEESVQMSRIRIGTVTRGDLIRDVSVEGRIVAAYRPTLFSQATGIADLLVEPGQRVDEGQELVRISSPELESELKRARSSLRATQADLERQRILAEQSRLQSEQRVGLLRVELEAAKRGMARAQKSRDEGILNAVEYEKAQDEVRVSELQLEVALKQADFEAESLEFEVENRDTQVEAQQLVVDEFQRLVDDLVIRSPADGIVSRVEIEDRDVVRPNQALVGVVDLSAFEVEIFVPESYADDVRLPTPAEIQFEGSVYPGEVRSLSPEVEGSRVGGSVTFVDKAPAGLKQNQRVSVRLILDSHSDVVKAPRGPFVESGGGRIAFVVEDGMATQRKIDIGAVSITEVEILSGLEPGEEIILSDMSRFEGADSIRLRD